MVSMVQDADLMRTYQETLAKWVQRQTGRPPQPADGAADQSAGDERPASAPVGSTVELQ